MINSATPNGQAGSAYSLFYDVVSGDPGTALGTLAGMGLIGFGGDGLLGSRRRRRGLPGGGRGSAMRCRRGRFPACEGRPVRPAGRELRDRGANSLPISYWTKKISP